jgi:hypothetical protein
VYTVLRYAAERTSEDREPHVERIVTFAANATAAEWRELTGLVLSLPATESKNRFIHVVTTQLPQRAVETFGRGLVQRMIEAIVTARCDDKPMQSNARSFNTRSWLDMMHLAGKPLTAQLCQKATQWGLTGIVDLCETENALLRAQDDLYGAFWENHHDDLLDLYVSMMRIFRFTDAAADRGREVDRMPRAAMPTTAPFGRPGGGGLRAATWRALSAMMALPAGLFRDFYRSLA